MVDLDIPKIWEKKLEALEDSLMFGVKKHH